ncbi:LD-carboxypeptidase [Marihabitans asiaticum]|uniref:LD-carboxypeptidase n=1 Tax=Marihabitans asiaticum TaxID=415218 RepID=UPI001478465F|nr:LD-carboxypeptidase [Marihabitans asiaticum]
MARRGSRGRARRAGRDLRGLRRRGYEVVEGTCLRDGSGHVSASREARADELMALLVDPEVAAVVPPWGGETGIDLLPLLDLDLLAASEPCWYVGFSDTVTTMLPLTLVAGWATLHGGNLMDTPYAPADGHLHWLDVATHSGHGGGQGTPFVQRAASHHRAAGWDDYAADPEVATMTLAEPTAWRLMGGEGGSARFSGRLVGGCVEVLSPLAGTRYADVPGFAPEEELVVYLEVAEAGPYEVARAVHGLRLAGWFDRASGVLVGRTPAPDAESWTQHDAVADALRDLDVPVVLDADIGHQQPQLPLVNGARAEVIVDGGEASIAQSMVPLG